MILVGNITFVEVGQSDYKELSVLYNVAETINFAIIHSIERQEKYSEEAVDKIEDNGEDYIITEIYNGKIIYDL